MGMKTESCDGDSHDGQERVKSSAQVSALVGNSLEKASAFPYTKWAWPGSRCPGGLGQCGPSDVTTSIHPVLSGSKLVSAGH